MSFSIKKFTACCAIITLTFLTACSDQSATDTLTNGGTSSQASSTKLLDSLALLYPDGQLPAERTAQASLDLSQNPAALKLTAETANADKGQSTTNTASTPIAAQAEIGRAHV